MDLLTWRILCLSSAALFIVAVILMLCLKLLKNKYYHRYTADELIKTVKTANSKNSVYFTSGQTRSFIKKYVICKTVYDKYVVCNFARSFEEITFFVVEYNKRKKVIGVLNITQRDTGDTSRVFALKRRCKYVNIVIGSAEGVEINSNIVKPLPMNKVRIHTALKSFALFLGLFVIRHFIVEFFGGIYVKQYFDNLYNYIAIGGSFALAVISYFITVLCFRRKNVKARNGGALEYEFV